MIYVHSKLMIVDDNYAIIGSANINDRSQTGDRDSELALVLEQTQKVKGTFNGKVHLVSPDIKQLRIDCWSSIFGNMYQYDDPLNKYMWKGID